MANKKVWLGKVLAEKWGYKVRQMGGTRTERGPHGTERSFFQPDGTIGVYAGRKKKVRDEFKTVEDALTFIDELHNKK